MSIEIPELQTERLHLRAPELSDYPVYRDFYADAAASAAYGGPQDAGFAWRRLASDLGHWGLRDFGMWSVIERETGKMVGGSGLVWPESWPRHELTWWIVPAARRRGFAFEASQAVVAFAYGTWNWPAVETHMDDDNEAARHLAVKLSGRITERCAFPDGKTRDVYTLPPPGDQPRTIADPAPKMRT
ncbi:MAG: GNAT family N-acetyltransferase [Pseudomonadota bacterium]